ncbi:MAG TPA: ABC transporter ATP-binding protein [Chloroflexota bacterium]|nr:ABC transporter ATP-binding protein [Chloroflexota bacterium]
MTPILQLDGVRHRFHVRGRRGASADIWAVDGVDLTVEPGDVVGIVGESGSGKSTLALIATGLLAPAEGVVTLDGKPLKEAFRPGRIQMVFQDPISSLDARMRVAEIVAEPMRARDGYSRAERRARTIELLRRVGLSEEHLNRRRSELSGGQCQRVAIARAMSTQPELVILDEPTSSLDVIVQARVLNLLVDFQEQFSTAYLFISHNLRVVEAVCHRVVVLYRGQVVEEGPVASVLSAPAHPYTIALEAAAPDIGSDAERIEEVQVTKPATADDVAEGCPYAPRCPLAIDICRRERPLLVPFAGERRIACHVVAAEGHAVLVDREKTMPAVGEG